MKKDKQNGFYFVMCMIGLGVSIWLPFILRRNVIGRHYDTSLFLTFIISGAISLFGIFIIITDYVKEEEKGNKCKK